MAVKMFNGKPLVIAGGNKAGPIAINPIGGSQVYGGIQPMDPKPPVAPPPAPVPQTFAPPPPVATSQVYTPPAPVLKAAPEFAPQPPPQPAPAPTFGPGNSLINKQIAAPSAAPNNYDTQAAQYAQNAGVGDYSGQTNEARQMILDQLKQLQSAPDRFALAQSQYDIFQNRAEPQYQQDIRGVGQKAAAFGRIGAGMTTNDLTGVSGQHQNLLSNERQSLINNALENTMGDRLNIQNALQGAGGLLGGQDLSLNQAKSNAALGQANAFRGMGQDQYGRQFNDTQQQTQQQGFQAGLDQQNIQNQLAQMQDQRAGQQQAWQQQYLQQQMALDAARQQNTQYPAAYGGGPSSASYGYNGA